MLITTFEAWNEANLPTEEWDYELPHRPTLRTCDDLQKPLWTGYEHGRAYAYYFGDDEDLTDCEELDALAITEWEDDLE